MFWVNKMLRDSSASLAVVELGLQVLTHDGAGGGGGGGASTTNVGRTDGSSASEDEVNSSGGGDGDGRLLILPESAGPREFINLGKSQASFSSAGTSTSTTIPTSVSSGSVLLLEAFIKDADQEDMIEAIPSLQYYRADRVATVHHPPSLLACRSTILLTYILYYLRY